MNYDPFQILQVNYTADLETIRNAFKNKALLHHPDRGGNPYQFDLCKRAYSDIYKYKKEQERQLHKEKRNITQLQQERTNQNLILNKTQQKQLERNFHQIFQNVKTESVNDIGYGHLMEKSTQSRDDNPTLSQEKRFEKRQLVIYEEPLPLTSLNENYEILGESKVNDFSNHAYGYTDYMIAHSEKASVKDLENLENVRNKPKYKSIDALQQARQNISYDMSPEELRRYQEKQRRETEMEEQRKMQFYQHVQNVEKKFNQIHNYLTY